MCYDVCILSAEADYAAMLTLELEDRGIYEAFSSAMRKCSERAEELGAKNK